MDIARLYASARKPSDAILELSNVQLTRKGVYFLFLRNEEELKKLNPAFYEEYSCRFNHSNLVYIGKADDLHIRLGQDLQGTGHASFFRSFGSLNYRPPTGNIHGKANFYFQDSDKIKIIDTIEENIIVNYELCEYKTVEAALVTEYCPIMNIQHNPQKSMILKALRSQCLRAARGRD